MVYEEGRILTVNKSNCLEGENDDEKELEPSLYLLLACKVIHFTPIRCWIQQKAYQNIVKMENALSHSFAKWCNRPLSDYAI